MSAIDRIAGSGGQPAVVLAHVSGAKAEVYEHGATVTKYATSNGVNVLWLSSTAIYNGAKGLRGGIPIVFPQFGPIADARLGVESMPQHGFARTQQWAVKSTTVKPNGDCECVFSLGHTEASLKAWPHEFSLEYTVLLSSTSLHTSLKIKNLDKAGGAPFAPQALLHTYFAVPDSLGVRVHGLEGSTFVDSFDGSKVKTETPPAIELIGEVDRIYQGETRAQPPIVLGGAAVAQVRLDTHVCLLDANDVISAELSADVVVWNPHVDKALGMGDFDDEGWKNMVCVEPGVVAANRPQPETNGAMVLAQTITPL
ncbi:galactose mutarotase-like domain-containing protein [Pelagophyceae sp. CCMP2097]|nr:galactose mutarotase-like domain-containing protein [Pelagophyceae sp. CCMP2097]|mmetsp:Transcript_11224/g.37447  ORF Transcript_11224/g.37447 Transcript_11224/m.37447 type:complete len:312 (-) Transcript_11224:25-960(-)